MKKAISTRGNATIGVKIAITGWNFQKSQNDQSDDALRCAYCLMFSTAYHTKEGANVNPLSRFLLPSASNIISGYALSKTIVAVDPLANEFGVASQPSPSE